MCVEVCSKGTEGTTRTQACVWAVQQASTDGVGCG